VQITRRSFVVRSSSIAGAIAAWHLSDHTLIAQAQPPSAQTVPKRQTLNGMSTTDPIISAWREGVDKLTKLPAASPFQWSNLAAIHGTAAGFNKCPHGNWYFLPWHRGFLTMYERKVRELTNFPDFALPYWDWTAQPTLPPAFAAPMVNGSSNPLFATRTLSGSLSPSIVGQTVMNKVLTTSPYEAFGTSRPFGQTTGDQSWIGRGTGTQGLLEQTPHNLVHNNVGGLMGSFQSALDPIFMMHHCNIDRIWAVWNAAGFANESDPLWRNMPFTNHFLNLDGSNWSPKVSDLFVPEQLGYTYGLPVPPVPIAAQWVGLKQMFAMQGTESAPGLRRFVTPITSSASAARPLVAQVKVDLSLLRQVTKNGALASGDDLLLLAQPSTAMVSGPKVVAVIRNVAVSQQSDTEFQVYLSGDRPIGSTPATDPSYVGTFGFFGGPHLGHEGDKPSVLLDLTSTIRLLYRTPANTPDTLTIQIVPVPIARGAQIPEAGTATPESIEVAIISG